MPNATASTIDLDAYCVGCGSDQHTVLDPQVHPHLRFCNCCWAWQKPIPRTLRAYIEQLQESR